MATGIVQGTSLERHNIWQGIVEWTEEAKNPTDTQKQTRHVPFQVSAYSKLKTDTWPSKLIMQFIPRQLIGNINGSYLKCSESVFFHPTPCEALEFLRTMMCSGFAGCVHFTSALACEIKILILFCTAEKKGFLGFIPNDQKNFVDHLRKVIQQETISHASMRQELSCINQSVPTQVPQTVTASQQAPVSVSSITQQITHPPTQGTVYTDIIQRKSHERRNIWQGILEWIEKAKSPTDPQKQTKHVPCQVLINLKNRDSPLEAELKPDTWPPKLIMQLMPKQLIGNIGDSYLKYSKHVYFHLTPCEALKSLTKMMNNGFAGCVHFTIAPACEIKILLLLYTEKKTYLGIIPNDQTNFILRLRKVIEQEKISQASRKQGQANPGTEEIRFPHPYLPQVHKMVFLCPKRIL